MGEVRHRLALLRPLVEALSAELNASAPAAVDPHRLSESLKQLERQAVAQDAPRACLATLHQLAVTIPGDTRTEWGPPLVREALEWLGRGINEAIRGNEVPPLPRHLRLMLAPQLVTEFVSEGRAVLDEAEAHAIGLVNAEDNPQLLLSLLRGLHTFKGAASQLGLRELSGVAHAMEGWLAQFGQGARALGEVHLSELLAPLLLLRHAVTELEAMVQKRAFGFSPALLQDLQSVSTRLRAGSGRARAGSDQAGNRGCRAGSSVASVHPAAEFLRVEAARLDNLRHSLARWQRAHAGLTEMAWQGTQAGGAAWFRELARLGALQREVEAAVGALERASLQPAFGRAEQLALALASALQKEVKVEIDEAGVEVDLRSAAALNDIVSHLVRNAVMHGLEPPEERRRRGKAATGTLWLSARQCEGAVVIEVRDDGAGLDPDAILSRAMEVGLVPPGKRLSLVEMLNLISKPGFSTSPEVSEAAGRGLGLEIVQHALQLLGGVLEAESRRGAGTAFQVYLPPAESGPAPMVETPLLCARVERSPAGSRGTAVAETSRREGIPA